MASFEETVLTLLTPVLFWRCTDLIGPQITDYSGNDFHGNVVSGSVVLGQPSAVETDPDARSVYIPGGFANNIAEITSPPPAPLLFTGNFTILCFVKHQVQSGFQYLFARGGIAGSTGSGLHFATSGSSNRSLFAWYRTDDGAGGSILNSLTAETSHLNDTNYFMGVVRNGAVLRLYRNAEVVAEDAGAGTGPLILPASNRVVFGAGANNLGPMKGWASELIICSHAATQSEIRAVYESAINAIMLSGVSNATPSAVLYSDVELDPVSFPFRHNWSDSLIERISFRTGISRARKGYESANVQRIKPRRELEISQVLRDNDEREEFRAKLTAQQNKKWFVPILEDRETLTTGLSAGSTLMPADVQYRDYEIGSWVELRQLNGMGQVVKHEHALITSLSPLTTAAIENDYDPYVSTIGPAKRGILEAQISPRGHTDAVEDLTVVARLMSEDDVIAPNRITEWTPTITYKGYEVFDPATWQSNDWSELRDYDVSSERSETDFDVGVVRVESDALAANEAFSYRMLIEGRDKQASLLGWFYARAGAARYLWVPTVQRNFTIVSAAGSNLTVAKHNYFENFAGSEFRRDLAFIYHNNTVALRRIGSVALSGANEVLSLSSAVPTQTNLRSVSYLRFCRLEGDTLEIARATDDKARFAWRFRELLSSPS